MSSCSHRTLGSDMVGNADAVQDDSGLHGNQRDDEEHRHEENGLDGNLASIAAGASRG
jgi:hypothetical protein